MVGILSTTALAVSTNHFVIFSGLTFRPVSGWETELEAAVVPVFQAGGPFAPLAVAPVDVLALCGASNDNIDDLGLQGSSLAP